MDEYDDYFFDDWGSPSDFYPSDMSFDTAPWENLVDAPSYDFGTPDFSALDLGNMGDFMLPNYTGLDYASMGDLGGLIDPETQSLGDLINSGNFQMAGLNLDPSVQQSMEAGMTIPESDPYSQISALEDNNQAASMGGDQYMLPDGRVVDRETAERLVASRPQGDYYDRGDLNSASSDGEPYGPEYSQYHFDDAVGGVEGGYSGAPSNYDSNFSDWARKNGVTYYTGDGESAGADNYARVLSALQRGAGMTGSGTVPGPASNPNNQRGPGQNPAATPASKPNQNPNTSNIGPGALAAMGGANMLGKLAALFAGGDKTGPKDPRFFGAADPTNWNGPRRYAQGGLIQMAEGGSLMDKLRELFAIDRPTTTTVRGRTRQDDPRDARDLIVPVEGPIPDTGRQIMTRGQQLREMERQGYARGGNIPGGQSDVVPINGAPGEYMMDADVVSALGDGSTEAGAARLDQMREAVRKHKRSAPSHSIPPKAKSPLAYMKGRV